MTEITDISKHYPEILLIEDEPSLRSLFSELMSSWGYPHRLAADGVEGIRLMEQKPSPIIITDLNMPSMDGLEVLRRVKNIWPGTEVIVITGYGTMENAILAMKKGAADFITKPVNFEHLRVVINKSMTRITHVMENAELRDLNNELRQVNRLKDRFINITNHEIRTPLTIIKGYLDIMEVPETLPELTREGFGIIKNTVNDMIHLLGNIHSLSVADEALIGRQKEVIHIGDFFHEIEAEFRPLFNKRNLRFEAVNKSDLEEFEGEKDLIKRALRELIQNAIKYTPEGKTIRLHVPSADASNIFLSVTDEGIGIPVEEQEFIFDRFYEVRDPNYHFTSNEDFMGGGLGIGLSIVKEIVENQKGSIFLESKPGEGSTFTVMLPRK